MPIINPPADLDFPGSTLILTEQMTFPERPRNGNFAFVDGALHIYGSVDNVTTWYPLTPRNQYYIYIQEDALAVWDVHHNLNTDSIIQMSYDQDGLTLDGVQEIIDLNQMRITFTEPKAGTVIFFASSEAQVFALEQIVAQKADKSNTYTKIEVDNKITDLVDAAPGALDTLNELAAALGDDPNFAATITAQLAQKADADSFSAANLLTQLKTVDGTGSGLDADLLDGLDSSKFARVDIKESFSNSLGVGGAAPGNTFDNGSALAIGDSDTGLRQNGDGILEVWANNQHTGTITTAGLSIAGDITATGIVTAYSDSRIKTELEIIPEAVSKVQALTGYTFSRTDMPDSPRQTGVLAQDLLKVLPEAVLLGEAEEDMMSVAYGNIVGLLIEAIKEQQDQIDELAAQLKELRTF